jgi:hypothetical protein
MTFQLGAMTVGDILDRGLKLLLRRLFTFYGITDSCAARLSFWAIQ